MSGGLEKLRPPYLAYVMRGNNGFIYGVDTSFPSAQK
jgi:hypothetical protein